MEKQEIGIHGLEGSDVRAVQGIEEEKKAALAQISDLERRVDTLNPAEQALLVSLRRLRDKGFRREE